MCQTLAPVAGESVGLLTVGIISGILGVGLVALAAAAVILFFRSPSSTRIKSTAKQLSDIMTGETSRGQRGRRMREDIEMEF